MGLDVSHDAFYGGYRSFNRLRQAVAWCINGSWPPHWVRAEDGSILQPAEFDETKGKEQWYYNDPYSPETHPGLWIFMEHSDCDGIISHTDCPRVADDLEALIPKLETFRESATGHLADGYVETLKRFIAGCRLAASRGEDLEFR
jgi:hypothetical protein